MPSGGESTEPPGGHKYEHIATSERRLKRRRESDVTADGASRTLEILLFKAGNRNHHPRDYCPIHQWLMRQSQRPPPSTEKHVNPPAKAILFFFLLIQTNNWLPSGSVFIIRQI